MGRTGVEQVGNERKNRERLILWESLKGMRVVVSQGGSAAKLDRTGGRIEVG